MARRVLLALVLAVSVACVGPTQQSLPLTPGNQTARKRLVLTQTYVAGVGGSEYLLPYGAYHAEGADERGVYYRAPIPIKKRGLFGGLLSANESLIEGGIFLPSSSFQRFLGVWLYFYDEHGQIDAITLPGTFNTTEGELWYLEPAEGQSESPAAE